VISLVSLPAVDRRLDKAHSRVAAYERSRPMANACALLRMYTGVVYNTSVDVRQCRDYLSAHHVRGGYRTTPASIRGLSTQLRPPKTLY